MAILWPWSLPRRSLLDKRGICTGVWYRSVSRNFGTGLWVGYDQGFRASQEFVSSLVTASERHNVTRENASIDSFHSNPKLFTLDLLFALGASPVVHNRIGFSQFTHSEN